MSGGLSGTAHPFKVDVARGRIPGFSIGRTFGRNTDVNPGTVPEDIWSTGGTLTYLSAAEQIDVASSSANDTAAGTGARTLTIDGLNSSFVQISETVTLNGVTPVRTVASFIRILGSRVSTAGSGGSNAGNITFTPAVTVAALQGTILVGKNRLEQSHATIPAGRNGYMSALFAGTFQGGADRTTSVEFQARAPGGVFIPLGQLEVSSPGSAFVFIELVELIRVVSMSDIRAVAIAASANNTIVTAGINYLLATE